MTDKQKKALTGRYPDEAVWSGHKDDRGEYIGEDLNPLKKGGNFCGGLPKDLVHPEGCSTNLRDKITELPDLLKAKLETTYEVMFRTGDVEKAGTDATISFILVGSKGSSGPFHVYARSDWKESRSPEVGTFERGNVDYAHVKGENVGEINQLRLSMSVIGDSPGWFVSEVRVLRKADGAQWWFKPDTWLAPDEPPPGASSTYHIAPTQVFAAKPLKDTAAVYHVAGSPATWRTPAPTPTCA